MKDDEMFDSLTRSMATVRMERPVEAILRRGSVRQKARIRAGVAAGGLAALAGVAFAAAPLTSPTGTTTRATTTDRADVKPVAWTLEKTSDSKPS